MDTLRKDEKKDLNEELKKLYGHDVLSKKDFVTIDGPFLHINKECRFFHHKDIWVPTLRFILDHPNTLPIIVVDMGAVKFVCSGADIMRPGITSIPDGLSEGDIVTITDENNHKPLAVGQCTLDSEGLRNATSGKIIKNLHFIGDKIWKLGEE